MKYTNTPAYWETETPELIITSRNVIRHYPNAGKVAVHGLDYYDPKSGELRSGRINALDLKALKDRPEQAARLIEILSANLPPLPDEGKAEVGKDV